MVAKKWEPRNNVSLIKIFALQYGKSITDLGVG